MVVESGLQKCRLSSNESVNLERTNLFCDSRRGINIMIQTLNPLLKVLIFALLISQTACDQISSLLGGAKKEDDSLFLSIEKMYDMYNKKELEGYCSFFSDEINVFKESGLGNTRIIAGKENFKSYYKRIFQTKRSLKITPLSHFTVYPWVMVKELIEMEEQVFEAAVGYRLLDGKIRDRMILSENFLVNKEKLSIALPKEKKSNEVELPPPHLPREPETPPAKTK